MAKLQKTTRGNGSVVWSLNIPQEIMEQMKWEKGQELEIVKNFDRLVVLRKEEDVSEVRDIPGHGETVEILSEEQIREDSDDKHTPQDEGASSTISEGSEGSSEGNHNDEVSGGGER
jgi:bifunctional DNA-binding transcriptional regulator/antitoxin component of YhaV-PrlF toxin-antitoxin module